jgi:hypothetical protein
MDVEIATCLVPSKDGSGKGWHLSMVSEGTKKDARISFVAQRDEEVLRFNTIDGFGAFIMRQGIRLSGQHDWREYSRLSLRKYGRIVRQDDLSAYESPSAFGNASMREAFAKARTK